MPSDAESIRIRVLTGAEKFKYFEKSRRYLNLHDLGRLMLNQGCRPEELISLPQADVDLAKGLAHIRRGKTKAAKRTLKLATESKTILAARLDGGNWILNGKKAGTRLTKLRQ